MPNPQIAALYVYPVKSLAGIALQSATAGTSGLAGDRQWMICDENGHMLTQRQEARLALIQPSITGTGLTLKAPGMGEINLSAPAEDADVDSCKVWKDDCPAQACAPDAGIWLQEFLKSKKKLSFFKVAPQATRTFINPERFGIKGQYFSDAAPYLIGNISSLDKLNLKLKEEDIPPVDIRHFRANVIISGLPAFSEHEYQYLTHPEDDFTFRLIDHCQRCSMITVDPDNGEFRPKATPFKSLSQLNSMPDKPKAPAFGVNATLNNENNVTLEVGQSLTIR